MIEPRKFLPLLAAAGLLIALHQGLDLLRGVAGVDLATPTGRVRLVMLLWSRSAPLLLADVFLISAAIGLGWSRSVVMLGRVHLGAGVVMLLAIPLFLMSAGGMINTIAGPSLEEFRVTVSRILLGLALLGGGALAAWRALSRFGAPVAS